MVSSTKAAAQPVPVLGAVCTRVLLGHLLRWFDHCDEPNFCKLDLFQVAHWPLGRVPGLHAVPTAVCSSLLFSPSSPGRPGTQLKDRVTIHGTAALRAEGDSEWGKAAEAACGLRSTGSHSRAAASPQALNKLPGSLSLRAFVWEMNTVLAFA